MLLSWKHFPNVSIYDFARGLATHTNLREPEKWPFSPHEGRLAEATTDSLQPAGEGKLKVSLPWLKTKKTDTDTNCHPITGSSDHYTLYDIFHERNTKDARDALRRIGLVPELAGWVNLQKWGKTTIFWIPSHPLTTSSWWETFYTTTTLNAIPKLKPVSRK